MLELSPELVKIQIDGVVDGAKMVFKL